MRSLALSSLVFNQLFEFFVPLLNSCVSNQLSLILSLEILSILSLLSEYVVGYILRRPLNISELIDHAADLATILLQDGVQGSHNVFCSFVSGQLNILDHGVFLYGL